MEINNTIKGSAKYQATIPAEIMVMGLGGAGGNAIKHMWELGIEGVNLVACNTDRQDLDKLLIPEENKIAIGEGLGAGNEPSVGEQMANDSIDNIRFMLESRNTKMLFIAAGMGGGTGTGSAPVVARLAREMDILSVAIVTMPPADEGPKRMNQAKAGLEKLRQYVDSIIVLSNEAITELYGDCPLSEAFNKANDIIAFAAKGIAEISTHSNNLVNVDFADVCNVVRDSGRAVMGVASARGDERAEKAVDSVIGSPLFEGRSISGASKVLINIAVSPNSELTANEAKRVRLRVQELAKSSDENGVPKQTDLIWGVSNKETLTDDELEVIIVATGFNAGDDIETPKQTEESVVPANRVPLQTLSTAPATLQPQLRSYHNIEQCRRKPAYVTRHVELKTTTGPLHKVDVGGDDEVKPQGPIQGSIF